MYACVSVCLVRKEAYATKLKLRRELPHKTILSVESVTDIDQKRSRDQKN